ncbi:MAG: hypothetical protein ACE5EM_13010 [Sphingomonadales bacterium]
MDDFDPDDWSLDEPRSGWRSIIATVSAAGAGLVPVGACPICMAGTVGVLSSLGLGFMLETRYLLPIIVGFLSMALLTLGYKARARRGYGPLSVGVAAAAAILAGKFLIASDLPLYAGLAGLSGAAVWKAWPIKNRPSGRCPVCDSPQ